MKINKFLRLQVTREMMDEILVAEPLLCYMIMRPNQIDWREYASVVQQLEKKYPKDHEFYRMKSQYQHVELRVVTTAIGYSPIVDMEVNQIIYTLRFDGPTAATDATLYAASMPHNTSHGVAPNGLDISTGIYTSSHSFQLRYDTIQDEDDRHFFNPLSQYIMHALQINYKGMPPFAHDDVKNQELLVRLQYDANSQTRDYVVHFVTNPVTAISAARSTAIAADLLPKLFMEELSDLDTQMDDVLDNNNENTWEELL